MTQSEAQFYRPDIDGLRALAVLSVVVYHAFPSFLSGGFIGVDIFFVISGYLITGIILKEQSANSFSIPQFYSKRVRRIFPALLTVLMFCLGVGWLALTFDEYRQLSKHTGASALFINNFILWRESGYFDGPGETKPLLHMWSLAVEEQFYLFWPVLLVLAKRFFKSLTLPIVFLLLSSLAFGVWAVYAKPVAAFYSPLARMWELLAGGLIAWLMFKKGVLWIRHHQVISALGIACFCAGLLLIDKTSLFPGFWALLPVLAGVSLVVASDSTFNQKVLAAPLLVWIGLISYPLYLWHWPLLVFARIFEGETPSTLMRGSLLLASFVLAWLTYKLIEKPLRFNKSSRKVVTALLIGMVGIFLFSYYILDNRGLAFRHHNKLNADPQTLVIGADRNTHNPECGLSRDQFPGMIWCIHDTKQPSANMAVLGDSKGEAIYYGLSRESSPLQSWIMIGPVNYLHSNTASLEVTALERVINDSKIETVVLSNALRGFVQLNKQTGYIEPEVSDEQILKWVDNYSVLVQTLFHAGKKVVFVADHPTLPDANDCIVGPLTPFLWLNKVVYREPNPRCEIAYSEHLQGTVAYQRFVELLRKRQPDLLVFDPSIYLCDVSKNKCGMVENNAFLYSYGDHISDYSSSKLARVLLEKMNSTSKNVPLN